VGGLGPSSGGGLGPAFFLSPPEIEFGAF